MPPAARPDWIVTDAARAPAHPDLPPGEVHAWTIALAAPDAELEALRALLSPDERARADAFRFEHLQRAFTVARGSLRRILARYARVPAADLRFTYDAHGKPALAVPAAGVQFNLSHSGDWAICALAAGARIGVDIEQVRALPDMDDLAERFFAPGERAALRALPSIARERAFFACWTRKEAYIKAIGLGLAQPLDAFEVSVDPDRPAALLSLRGEPDAHRRWRLVDAPAPPGYAAAVAVEGALAALRAFVPASA